MGQLDEALISLLVGSTDRCDLDLRENQDFLHRFGPACGTVGHESHGSFGQKAKT